MAGNTSALPTPEEQALRLAEYRARRAKRDERYALTPPSLDGDFSDLLDLHRARKESVRRATSAALDEEEN